MKVCKPSYRMNKFPGCGEQKTILRYGSCQDCFIKWVNETEEGKAWFKKNRLNRFKKNQKAQRTAHRTKKREANIKSAMRLADMYFSRYMRLLYSKDGECTCYTCGIIHDIKNMDNGHYQKREHKSTRYHENNCRPQCKTCNGDTKHNGKQAEFRVNLVNEIGEKEVSQIEALAREAIKANYKFYKETADRYRLALNELQKELGVKYW